VSGSDLLWLIGAMLVWVIVQNVILPRFGVPT
jgi:hypothetical protein